MIRCGILAIALIVSVTWNAERVKADDGQPQSLPYLATVADGSSQHLHILPPQQPEPPRLGILAVSTGSSVQVTSVGWGTPAQRLGLEPGDRILQINGHRVRSLGELRHVLEDAVQYHHGVIDVLIDNVRARRGEWGAQRYVLGHTHLDTIYHLHGGPAQPAPY